MDNLVMEKICKGTLQENEPPHTSTIKGVPRTRKKWKYSGYSVQNQ